MCAVACKPVFVNPRHTCAVRVTVVLPLSVCVCVCVCLLPLRLTLCWFVQFRNDTTYSACNKNQLYKGFSVKMLRCEIRPLSPQCAYKQSAIFLRKTCMRIINFTYCHRTTTSRVHEAHVIHTCALMQQCNSRTTKLLNYFWILL